MPRDKDKLYVGNDGGLAWGPSCPIAAGKSEIDYTEEELAQQQLGALTMWGNERTMNINPLVLGNVTCSPYYRVQLATLQSYHEVVDEIYYRVQHLEPWERGSRTMGNNTGMCGGVRGVGTGGIVSSCFCLVVKCGVLRLTRKQLMSMINHHDSPYIRGIGFLYIRFCQDPNTFIKWFEPYLDDAEEIDVKAGGGKVITIGEMCRMMLGKLEWFATRFPRIPVHVQKQIAEMLAGRKVEAAQIRVDAYNARQEDAEVRAFLAGGALPQAGAQQQQQQDGGDESFDGGSAVEAAAAAAAAAADEPVAPEWPDPSAAVGRDSKHSSRSPSKPASHSRSASRDDRHGGQHSKPRRSRSRSRDRPSHNKGPFRNYKDDHRGGGGGGGGGGGRDRDGKVDQPRDHGDGHHRSSSGKDDHRAGKSSSDHSVERHSSGGSGSGRHKDKKHKHHKRSKDDADRRDFFDDLKDYRDHRKKSKKRKKSRSRDGDESCGGGGGGGGGDDGGGDGGGDGPKGGGEAAERENSKAEISAAAEPARPDTPEDGEVGPEDEKHGEVGPEDEKHGEVGPEDEKHDEPERPAQESVYESFLDGLTYG